MSPLIIHAISEIPVGAGLGSSASFCVCCVTGILKMLGLVANDTESLSQEDLMLVNKWAFIGEKIIHGKPSGVDNSVATLGKVLHTIPCVQFLMFYVKNEFSLNYK